MSVGKIIALVVAVLALGYFFWSRRGDISSEEAHRLVADGAVLLDVRSPGEFAGGHIDGAVNIPVSSLNSRLAELPDKDKAIVVYCASGVRSASAAGALKSAGYRQVHNLGGIGRW